VSSSQDSGGAEVASHAQRYHAPASSAASSGSSQETAQRIVAALLPVVGQQQQRQQQQGGAAGGRAEPLGWHMAEASGLAPCQHDQQLVPLQPQPPNLGGLPSGSGALGPGPCARAAKERSLLSEKLGELRKWESTVRGWGMPGLSLWSKP
jgi:hypothetical protein